MAPQRLQRRNQPVSPRRGRCGHPDSRKALVAAGYDALVDAYGDWSARSKDPGRERLGGELMARLPAGSRVLDVGCGAGIPSTRMLAKTHVVTGVDISAAQLVAARRNVPTARFVHADMATIDFPADSFDGVAALYSISHLPSEGTPA